MKNFTIARATRFIRLIAINVVIIGLLLVVIEGLTSFMLIGRDMINTQPVAERRHTRYDPELGWVNEPSLYRPDMYAPGVYLRTNSQGFRNNRDFDSAVPNGKYRIICSGDSFTLGYGVDNDHTWCQYLTSLDPRLETLNMGQGGYGVDQAYLWYKRDALKFAHQVHLLAFITDDFRRMQSDTFHRYGKPVIEIENGALVVKNVPVPKRTYLLPWLTSNIENLSRLHMVEFFKRVAVKFRSVTDDAGQLSREEKNETTQKVMRLIFEDLKRLNKDRSSTLFLVYLPTLRELKDRGKDTQEWPSFIQSESQALEIPLINVLKVFQALPYEEVNKNFDPLNRHLSIQGNEFVARVIYKELRNHRAISGMLSPKRRK